MWRFLRNLVLLIVGVALGVSGWIAYQLTNRPSLAAYSRYELKSEPPRSEPRGVSVTFLGVSTVLVSDGETSIMTDGFFTRPGSALRIFSGAPITPDRAIAERVLSRLGVQKLDAIFVVHSHYDHAMDAPMVAELTGAKLVGSESTANVARGWGLPETQITVVEPGEPMQYGAFQVTMIRSKHFPLPFGQSILGKDITRPLVPPASAFDYLEGGSYSVLIEHPLGSILVQGSAGWRDGALDAYSADVVLLGVGGLGRAGSYYQDEYFNQVVEAVRAHMVIPIHYDDFTLPIERALEANPMLFDDVPAAFDYLISRAGTDDHLTFALLPPLRRVVLFEPQSVGPAGAEPTPEESAAPKVAPAPQVVPAPKERTGPRTFAR